METIRETYRAQQTLHDATENANTALEKAMQADDLAKNASSAAEKLKDEAIVLGRNATLLGEDAQLLGEKVNVTEIQLNNLLDWTKTNTSLINEAKDKVSKLIECSQPYCFRFSTCVSHHFPVY